jgi:magnesium-transporting ATPase (P-type)
LPLADLIKKLDTNFDVRNPHASLGLNRDRVADRAKKYGLNEMPKPKKRLPIFAFFEILTNLFNVLLFAAGSLYIFLFVIQPDTNGDSVCDLTRSGLDLRCFLLDL